MILTPGIPVGRQELAFQHEVPAGHAGHALEQDLEVRSGIAADVGPHHDPVG